jgi:hypothetical protein
MYIETIKANTSVHCSGLFRIKKRTMCDKVVKINGENWIHHPNIGSICGETGATWAHV